MTCARRGAIAIASAAALIVAAPASLAGPSPATFPVADVTIVYSVAGVADRETLSVAPGRKLQRVDAPGGVLSVVTDLAAGRMTVIDRARRTVTVLPAPSRAIGPLGLSGNAAGLGRVGEETIAGVRCSDWSVPQPPGDPGGGPTLACLDADGDTLRLASGDLTLAQAVSVSHAPLGASVFAPPAGFGVGTPRPAP